MRTQSTRRRPARSVPDELDALLHAQASVTAGDGLYGRTSSEEQAEKGTIKNQQEYLGERARLDHWPVAGEYWDDGVSGTIPLEDRPAGRRLLEDAKAGRLRRVIVYNLTRLGRTLRVILDAYDQLQAYGVEVVSATEPIDTSTPIGKFIFQLLGSLAELDRATTLDKLSGGRDRRAREGRWTGGPIPFGLTEHPEDLGRDIAPRLVPSARLIAELGQTEAEAAVALFEAIDGGSTPVAELRRLNALGVNSHTRYAGQAAPSRVSAWSLRRLQDLLRNPIYKGEHTVGARRGPITRAFPALVDAALWERVQRAMAARRAPDGKRSYLLRGLVVCAGCGCRFSGFATTPRKGGRTFTYYRCNSQLAAQRPEVADRCTAKTLPTAWLEGAVWGACRDLVLNDQEAQTRLRRQVLERQEQTAARQAAVTRLEDRLTALSTERANVLAFVGRMAGRVAGLEDDAERQLLELADTEAGVRAELARLRTQDEVAQLVEARLARGGATLARLRERVEWIDAHPDRPDARAEMRGVMEDLVIDVAVTTTGTGRAKTAAVVLHSAYADEGGAVPLLPYAMAGTTSRRGSVDHIRSPFVLTVPLSPVA